MAIFATRKSTAEAYVVTLNCPICGKQPTLGLTPEFGGRTTLSYICPRHMRVQLTKDDHQLIVHLESLTKCEKELIHMWNHKAIEWQLNKIAIEKVKHAQVKGGEKDGQ